ncbi:MAG TPA: carboxypeptidase-like regulatory domain-containing protein [Acidothermaceae bacterium]|nr:carboxypeptidase-like regulatory domain-containing protein [Acidothermaceae bacterium]
MRTTSALRSGMGKRLSAFAVCVAMCGASVALLGSPAAAVTAATVTGSVTAGGHAVSAAAVSLYNADTNAKIGTATTDTKGTFTETGITVPRVKLGVVKAGWATTYAFDKYTLASANIFWLGSGQKLTLPKAITLYPEAAIEGQVLGWMDPLSYAKVTVYSADTGTAFASTDADVEGDYRIGGLPAGHFKVGATSPGWLPGFANGKSTLATANVFALSFGQTLREQWNPAVLYIDLDMAGVVDGSVMGINNDPVWGWDDPLGGVTVSVLNASTGAVLGTATTNSLGDYSVGGLPRGDVKVRFSKAGWLTTYADGKYTLSAAGVYHLEPFYGLHLGQLVIYGQPAVMGQILGNFDPLGGATVTVYDATTGKALKSVTLASYQYEYHIGGLPTGPIKVGATAPGWLPGFADHTPNLASARVFALEPGNTLVQSWSPMSLYIDLTPEAFVSGTVNGVSANPTAAYNGPMGGVTVTVFDAATGKPLASGQTDAGGKFRIGGLNYAATIKVQASKPGWTTAYAFDKFSLATANTFSMGYSLELTMPKAITVYEDITAQGQVYGLTSPLAGATVTVYNATTGATLKTAITDTTGRFKVSGLPTQSVKIGASKTGWITGYAFDKKTLATANVFTVNWGQTLTLPKPMVLHH